MTKGPTCLSFLFTFLLLDGLTVRIPVVECAGLFYFFLCCTMMVSSMQMVSQMYEYTQPYEGEKIFGSGRESLGRSKSHGYCCPALKFRNLQSQFHEQLFHTKCPLVPPNRPCNHRRCDHAITTNTQNLHVSHHARKTIQCQSLLPDLRWLWHDNYTCCPN